MEKNWNSNWDGFKPGRWNRTSVNVRNFIQENYTPYEGDDSFLAGPTEATTKLWAQVMDLSKQEREAGGVLDMDTKIVSTITSHGPGYLNKDLEQIVGLQTDKPLKRAFMPYGGIRMAEDDAVEHAYLLASRMDYTITYHDKEISLTAKIKLAKRDTKGTKIRV